MIETLCWTCTAPGAGRCDWDRAYKPVEGWNALPNVMLMGGKLELSHLVLKCPLYVPCKTIQNLTPQCRQGYDKLRAAQE